MAKSSHRAKAGFTLIELVVAIALVGILFGAVALGVGSILGTKAKTAAGQLSGTIRSLYDTASLSGKTCRLVISMPSPKDEDGETKYWAECAAGNVTSRKDRDQELKDEARRLELEEREAKRGGGKGAKLDTTARAFGAYSNDEPTLADLLAQEKERISNAAKYSQYTNPEVTPQTLPSSVRLSVWTRHQTAAAKDGTAYLYFFPQGYTEKAMVFVKQGNNVWTITVSPLTGKTAVVGEELEVPRS